ncbi:MAG: CsiV family protein [Pseudomonadota bacterium]
MIRTMVWLSILCAFSTTATARWYTIELLAFAYPEQPAAESVEHWPADPEEPDWDTAAGDVLGARAPASGVRLVKYKRLAKAAATLRQQGLTILAHTRWQQRVAGRERGRWYQIDTEDLRGLIQMGRGRFLHFTADWWLQGAEQTYRINMQRRLKSGDLHYLDHPKMGVLLRVEPVYTKPKPAPTPQPETKPAPVQPDATTPSPDNSLPRATPDLS